MRLGVLGGTFNPIHYGHLRVAEEAGDRLGLERVIFLPAGNPPFKSSELAEAGKRYEMVGLAVAHNPRFEVSDVEIKGAGKSYTVETMDRLRAIFPGDEIFFILGIDAFLDIPNWREPQRLVAGTDFVLIRRPPHSFAELEGSPFLEPGAEEFRGLDRGMEEPRTVGLRGGRRAVLLGTTPLHISSTEIRSLASLGRSIKYLLPESVESFIMSDGLYAA